MEADSTQIRSFKRTAFIVNPRSGTLGGRRSVIHTIDRIWGHARRDYIILVTTRREEGVQLARKSAESGYDLVVAVGGDGTLNEVVRGVLDRDVAVGLIPAGSGNGFARYWKMPLNPATVCKGLLYPRVVRCDVGQANQYIFLVTFGCAFDAYLSERYAQSKMRGIPSYFYHAIKAFKDYRPGEITVYQGEQESYRGRPFLFTLSNTRGYGGGTVIAPEARVDDGLLDFCSIDPLPLKTMLRNVPRLFNGGIGRVPTYQHDQFTAVKIIRSEDGPIHVDGDPFPDGREIAVTVLPSALQFALPT